MADGNAYILSLYMHVCVYMYYMEYISDTLLDVHIYIYYGYTYLTICISFGTLFSQPFYSSSHNDLKSPLIKS